MAMQKVSSHTIWKRETFLEEDVRYKKPYTQDNDASVPFTAGTLGPHTVLPIAIDCLLYFPEFHGQSEISSLSKVILVLGKAGSYRAPNLGCRGAGSPGWFDVLPKTLHEMWCISRHIVVMRLPTTKFPTAVAFWIILIVSGQECSSLTQNLMQIHCSTCLFWMSWLHSIHAHSVVSTAPSD